MAAQLPNFLSVPVRTPDYSGLGDIVSNYYSGKAMPKDDLIKAIQAEFARPNAEQSLQASKLNNSGKRLSNQKEQLDINKLMQEMADQKAFERQLQQALSGGGAVGAAPSMGGANGATPMNMPQRGAPMPPMAMPAAPQMPAGIPGISVVGEDNFDDGLDRSKMDRRYVKIDQAATGLPASAYGRNASAANNFETKLSPKEEADFQKWKKKYAPNDSGNDYDLRGAFKAGLTPDATTGHWPDTFKKPNHPTFSNQSVYAAQAPQLAGSWQGENYVKPNAPAPEEVHEVVVSKGSPHLAGVDLMYEQNPLSRALLEKKGFKKTQEVKFDNKTGKTTIMTKYPSGKVTLQSIGGATSTGEGIPLTNKMISAHQEKIAAIDNAVPVIKEIIDQKGFQPYPRGFGMGMVPGFMGQSATYNSLVKSALDTLMKAYGLPSTNEGISTVKDQLLIEHGETIGHYRKRLKGLLKDLQRRKEYSENEVKRSNKVNPVDSSAGSNDTYSSDDWEAV